LPRKGQRTVATGVAQRNPWLACTPLYVPPRKARRSAANHGPRGPRKSPSPLRDEEEEKRDRFPRVPLIRCGGLTSPVATTQSPAGAFDPLGFVSQSTRPSAGSSATWIPARRARNPWRGLQLPRRGQRTVATGAAQRNPWSACAPLYAPPRKGRRCAAEYDPDALRKSPSPFRGEEEQETRPISTGSARPGAPGLTSPVAKTQSPAGACDPHGSVSRCAPRRHRPRAGR